MSVRGSQHCRACKYGPTAWGGASLFSKCRIGIQKTGKIKKKIHPLFTPRPKNHDLNLRSVILAPCRGYFVRWVPQGRTHCFNSPLGITKVHLALQSSNEVAFAYSPVRITAFKRTESYNVLKIAITISYLHYWPVTSCFASAPNDKILDLSATNYLFKVLKISARLFSASQTFRFRGFQTLGEGVIRRTMGEHSTTRLFKIKSERYANWQEELGSGGKNSQVDHNNKKPKDNLTKTKDLRDLFSKILFSTFRQSPLAE